MSTWPRQLQLPTPVRRIRAQPETLVLPGIPVLPKTLARLTPALRGILVQREIHARLTLVLPDDLAD